jgi:hypothetical protein
MEGQLMW